jgi:hypothetical protein
MREGSKEMLKTHFFPVNWALVAVWGVPAFVVFFD